MHSLILTGFLAATALAASDNDKPAKRDDMPTLVSDNKTSDIFEVIIEEANGTIQTTTSTGASPPQLTTWMERDGQSHARSWKKTGELHEQVLVGSNGTTYTTTTTWDMGTVFTYKPNLSSPTPATATSTSSSSSTSSTSTPAMSKRTEAPFGAVLRRIPASVSSLAPGNDPNTEQEANKSKPAGGAGAGASQHTGNPMASFTAGGGEKKNGGMPSPSGVTAGGQTKPTGGAAENKDNGQDNANASKREAEPGRPKPSSGGGQEQHTGTMPASGAFTGGAEGKKTSGVPSGTGLAKQVGPGEGAKDASMPTGTGLAKPTAGTGEETNNANANASKREAAPEPVKTKQGAQGEGQLHTGSATAGFVVGSGKPQGGAATGAVGSGDAAVPPTKSSGGNEDAM